MKLWEKDVKTDVVMERLTVGDDRKYDAYFLSYDCLGSAAHAQVLFGCAILTSHETLTLLTALQEIYHEAEGKIVPIPDDFEDVHSYLEHTLTQKVGDIGKKIHTGRSRNDQVILVTRMFLRSAVVGALQSLSSIALAFVDKYIEDKDLLMAGYTHLQPAMPTTVGTWMHAFLEGVLELIRDGLAFLEIMNTNPLGAAAGFGSSLTLDRELSAMLLGFSRAQRNFIDIQNSRGRYEDRFLYWCSQIGSIFEKFAWDIELFCTKEFGFAKLPDELTTGSSIMPQKKNPDIIELLRARSAMMKGIHHQLQWITGKLPSNYHRDYQLVKAPLMQGANELINILDSVLLVLPNIQFNQEGLQKGLGSELYATYEAYRMVKNDVPFREAYKKTAEIANSGAFKPEDYLHEIEVIKKEVDRYFSFSQSEQIELSVNINHWVKNLQKIPHRVFSI